MATKKAKIDALLMQRAEIDAAIKEAKKTEAKQQATARTERARIIGMAVMTEMDKDTTKHAELLAAIEPIIDENTTKAKDRKMLGLLLDVKNAKPKE